MSYDTPLALLPWANEQWVTLGVIPAIGWWARFSGGNEEPVAFFAHQVRHQVRYSPDDEESSIERFVAVGQSEDSETGLDVIELGEDFLGYVHESRPH